MYSTLLDPNDLNEWSLVLQVFNESAVGAYTCSGGGENSATFVIGTSECAPTHYHPVTSTCILYSVQYNDTVIGCLCRVGGYLEW